MTPTASAIATVTSLAVSGLALVGAPAAPASQSPEPRGVWPLAGATDVVRPFEPPQDRFARGHRGVDLAGVAGQPVVAAMAGRISFAGSIAGRPVVVVQHGETRTTYEPVLAEVQVSDPVDRGERLGWLAAVGSHCAPAACLHWGWRRGETYLDPLTLVGARRVRLLPLREGAPAPAPDPASAPELANRPGSGGAAGTTAPADPRPVLVRGPWWPFIPKFTTRLSGRSGLRPEDEPADRPS